MEAENQNKLSGKTQLLERLLEEDEQSYSEADLSEFADEEVSSQLVVPDSF